MPKHPPRAILDADILYSRVLYEFMGRIAAGIRELDLVWSDQLIDEATRVLRTRKGLPPNAAERWVSYLQIAFPAGRVDIGDALADDTLSSLTSDPDDLHVCALAIAANADYLFTADRG
jgi:predicted nucleic acid-binding protein